MTTATPETFPRFKPGARLRSYDFPDNRDCYVEGTLTGYADLEGCERYLIQADRRVWQGTSKRCTTLFTPPVNGTRSILDRVCNGVEQVTKRYPFYSLGTANKDNEFRILIFRDQLSEMHSGEPVGRVRTLPRRVMPVALAARINRIVQAVS